MNGITTYQNGLGIDDKLRSKNGTTVRYFITDHLGSTVALTDANGAITSSTTYDSFGNAIPKQAAGSAASGIGSAASSTGSAASSAGNATPNIATSYRYTGREYDEETGLYYYRNRWYDSEIGRFISEDPIGFAGGDINLYGYVWNNPQSWTDPSGNSPCKKGQKQDPRTEEQKKCDEKLAATFGGKNAVAAGSGFEPPNLFGSYSRTPPEPRANDRRDHLSSRLHLYYSDDKGKNAGEHFGDVYIPAGGRYAGAFNRNMDSYMFYYRKLGNQKSVYLVVSHVKDFVVPKGVTRAKTKIGQIGGKGGISSPNPGGQYIHVHAAILDATFRKNRRTGKVSRRPNLGKLSGFYDVFCR